jgi:hypothetical protein
MTQDWAKKALLAKPCRGEPHRKQRRLEFGGVVVQGGSVRFEPIGDVCSSASDRRQGCMNKKRGISLVSLQIVLLKPLVLCHH